MLKTPYNDNGLTAEQKKEKLEKNFKEIMETLGLDLTDDSLCDTPRRLSKMYVDELFCGLDEKSFPKMTTIENKMGLTQMVLIKNIKVMSVCEHHFQPIHGRCSIAYVPKNKVLGLSKFNRIVNHFSRRPQVQERLTNQIADKLQEVLGTDNIAVYIDAKHYCVISRGIEDENSSTSTCEVRGVFLNDPAARAEFFSAAK